MLRPNRIFVEGGVYHVYSRLGRGERVFDQEMEAAAFVELLLNPVTAGIVGDPAEYRWSGHRDLLDVAELRSHRRTDELVPARELLMILGVERFGLKVKDLARQLRKSPDGMTQTIARAARNRTGDNTFRRDLNKLDRALAGAGE